MSSVSSGGVELDRTVASIRVGYRFRQDLGDLDELCESIEQLGLLQPITITPDGTLVCGARRLAAVKRLGWERVKVWITAIVSSRLSEVLAEQHENTIRKPFTPSEAAALYAELKQLYAAEAARRQQATQFTSQHNPRQNGGSDGGANFAPPSEQAGSAGPAGKARRQAARAITGRSSYLSLDRVIEVKRLAEDPATPEPVRETARRELAEMDADGRVYGHYLTVQATANTDTLARLAHDPTQPAAIRARAADELEALDPNQPAAELVEAAKAAIARATTHDDPDAPATGTRPRLVAIKRYGLRALLATIEEMDGWWQHYDPDEIAVGLTEEQWQRLCANLDGSTTFVQAIAAARHKRESSADRPPHAACF
jgi:ParB family chromosome partitioning protein